MSKRWKLFALMAVFAFGVTLISWPRSANADLGTLTVSPTSATVGQTVTVTGSLSNLSGASVTMIASTGNWVTGTVSTGEAVVGTGTPVLAFTSSGSTVSSTLVGTYTCAAAGTVTFTLSQNPAPSAGASFLTTTLTCGTAAPAVVNVTPPAAQVNTPATISGTCVAAAELLNAVGPGQFVAFPPPVNSTVVSATSVSCNAAGVFSVTFICTGDGIVTFTLNNASGTLYCGNTSNILQPFCPTGYPYGATLPQYPFNTQYPYASAQAAQPYGYNSLYSFCNFFATPVAAPLSLAVTASASQVACGSSVFVTVKLTGGSNNGYYYNQNQYVADGTQVSLSTTGGTLNPTTATTQGGSVLATFQAPTTSGAVTISAASGNATNSVVINVDCPVVVVPAPPQVIVPPQVISPPNTGDAGLVAELFAD